MKIKSTFFIGDVEREKWKRPNLFHYRAEELTKWFNLPAGRQVSSGSVEEFGSKASLWGLIPFIALLGIIMFVSFTITVFQINHLSKNSILYQKIASAKVSNSAVVSTQSVTPLTNITTIQPQSSVQTPTKTTSFASIPKIFLAGGSSNSVLSTNNVLSSTDGRSWSWGQQNPNASWSPRSNHTLTLFGTGMWVIGGANEPSTGGVYVEYNDVYVGDGNAWVQFMANAPWPARLGHTAVSLNGRLLIMGGSSFLPPVGPRTYFNDVWSVLDSQFLGNAPWVGRQGHASVVFNNKVWVLGGETANQSLYKYVNDVWSSPDGINWTQETASAQWPARTGHSAVVFNGKIFLMGGFSTSLSGVLNDVWSSPDGINWTQETASAQWPAKIGHVSLVFGGYIWIIGGFDFNQSGQIYTDAWKSSDGINWTQETTNIPNFGGVGFAGVVLP